MNQKVLLGIDIGTTSVKVCLVDELTREELANESKDTQSNIPTKNKSHEQNVRKIVSTLHNCILRLPKEYLKNVKHIGICGQMHGIVLWNSPAWNNKYELVINNISNLFTWQDTRCDENFISKLPKPDSHLRAYTGYGVNTLLWFLQNDVEFINKYQYAGTIQDFVVAMLCNLDFPIMSDQNAASWGYYNCKSNTWNKEILLNYNSNFPIHLLPKVQQSGTIAGLLYHDWLGINKSTPINVALGDLQCSVLATLQYKTDAIINISTSAQIAFIDETFQPKDHYNIDNDIINENNIERECKTYKTSVENSKTNEENSKTNEENIKEEITYEEILKDNKTNENIKENTTLKNIKEINITNKASIEDITYETSIKDDTTQKSILKKDTNHEIKESKYINFRNILQKLNEKVEKFNIINTENQITNLEIQTNPDLHQNFNIDISQHINKNINLNLNPNTELYTNTDLNPNTELYTNTDLNPNKELCTNTNLNLNTELYTNTETYTNLKLIPNMISNEDLDINTDLYKNSDIHSNTDIFIKPSILNNLNSNINIQQISNIHLENNVNLNTISNSNTDLNIHSNNDTNKNTSLYSNPNSIQDLKTNVDLNVNRDINTKLDLYSNTSLPNINANTTTNLNLNPNPNKDLQPSINQNLQPNTNQDLQPNTNQDLQPNTNQDLQSNTNQNLQPNTNISNRNNIEYFPYFNFKYIAVGASMNGGNCLATFICTLQNWFKEFGFNVPQNQIWNKLINNSKDSKLNIKHIELNESNLIIIPTLLKDRHLNFSSGACILNINNSNLNFNSIFLSLCKSIILNLINIINKSILIECNINRIIGIGSCLIRNYILQYYIRELYQFNLIIDNQCKKDASYGAAISTILNSSIQPKSISRDSIE